VKVCVRFPAVVYQICNVRVTLPFRFAGCSAAGAGSGSGAGGGVIHGARKRRGCNSWMFWASSTNSK